MAIKDNRTHIEFVSIEEAYNIAKQDGKAIATDIDKYAKANTLQYYIAINTWLMILQERSPLGHYRLCKLIQRDGLLNTIKRSVEAANSLIQTGVVEDSLFRNFYHDICDTQSKGRLLDDKRPVWDDPTAAFLFVTRYLKRFSPQGASSLDRDTIAGFHSSQNRLKQKQHYPAAPQFILDAVRDEVATLFNWDKICEELEKIDVSDLELTSGAAYDARSPLVSKLLALGESMPEFFYEPFGIPCAGVYPRRDIEFTNLGEYKPVKMACVPKSYKASRTIAMEQVARQAYAHRVFTIVSRYLPDWLDIHHQERNQDLAYEGSLDGELATLDLHAASDMVSWVLVQEIFPKRFVKILDKVRPNFYEVGKKRYPLYAFATMGNSMTFWVETVVFGAIVAAASKWAKLFNPGHIYVSAYGDDIICRTDYAETVIEWLEACGFIVNREKSFYTKDQPFRESCGEDFYLGQRVSSLYFPRFPIYGTVSKGKVSFASILTRDGFSEAISDSTSRVVDLQHKLSSICDTASVFLADLLMEAHPKMTTSSFGSICDDVWEYEDRPVPGRAPAGEFIDALDNKGRQVRKLRRIKSDQVRECHYSMHPSPNAGKLIDTPEGRRLYDLYKYQEFLKHGPRYDDSANIFVIYPDGIEHPLSEFLGISEPPLSYEEAASTSLAKWSLTAN